MGDEPFGREHPALVDERGAEKHPHVVVDAHAASERETERQTLPEKKPLGGFGLEPNGLQGREQRVGGRQFNADRFGRAERFKGFHGDGLVKGQMTDSRAPESRQVGARAERSADVFGEHADVGALRDERRHCKRLAVEIGHGEFVNDDAARLALDGLAPAGKFVKAPAVLFEGGVHGRNLFDFARPTARGGFDRLESDTREVARFKHLPLDVARRRRDAELHASGVALVGVQEIG